MKQRNREQALNWARMMRSNDSYSGGDPWKRHKMNKTDFTPEEQIEILEFLAVYDSISAGSHEYYEPENCRAGE